MSFGQFCPLKFSKRPLRRRPFFFGNTLIWTEKPSQYQWRSFFSFFFFEITFIWTEKPSQYQWRPFFVGDYLNLDRKSAWFVGQNLSHFLGNRLVSPKSFWAPTPMLTRWQFYQKFTYTKNVTLARYLRQDFNIQAKKSRKNKRCNYASCWLTWRYCITCLVK